MTAAGLGLGVALLLLAGIDLRIQRLPDILTLPLVLVGLVLAVKLGQWVWLDRAAAAFLAWATFTALAAVYRRHRGREGLGGGDAKLLAAGGAWVGLAGLPWVVLLASLSALVFIATHRPWPPDRRLPFGPFLAASIWLVWLLSGRLAQTLFGEG